MSGSEFSEKTTAVEMVLEGTSGRKVRGGGGDCMLPSV